MTFTKLITCAAMAIALCACTNKKDTSTTTDIQSAVVTPIADNAKPRLMPRALFPAASDSLVAALGLADGVPSSVCAVLVETDGKQLLFDAANGAPDSQLMSTLDSMGIAPQDIDCIFITHLHGDHIGGLLCGDSAAFVSALLYVPAREHEAWMAMPEKSTEKWRKILAAYQGRTHFFVIGDALPCGIEAMAAYGHTPGHTIYRIDNHLIVGDIMHGVALQMENPDICARFDMNADSAIISRKAVLDLARRDSLTLYGMHFPEPYMLTFK